MRNLVCSVVLALFCAGALAQTETLRVHHFLPEGSPVHQQVLLPWARKVERESAGRLTIEVTPEMRLGGAPAELYGQAVNGKVDAI